MLRLGTHSENIGVDPDECCSEIFEFEGERVIIRGHTPTGIVIGVLDLSHGIGVPV